MYLIGNPFIYTIAYWDSNSKEYDLQQVYWLLCKVTFKSGILKIVLLAVLFDEPSELII